MDLQLKPLTLDLNMLHGLSPKLIASHHENNYAGAVKRLVAIRKQLSELDWSSASVFVINGLKREELGRRQLRVSARAVLRCIGRRWRAAVVRALGRVDARLRLG